MWCPILKDETVKLYKLPSAEIIPKPSEIIHQNVQFNMGTPSLLDTDIHKTAHEKEPMPTPIWTPADKQATAGSQAHSHLPSG